MKRFVALLLVAFLLVTLVACGASYTCYECGKTTSKAYYDYSMDKEHPLCENCARSYWAPYDCETFRIK